VLKGAWDFYEQALSLLLRVAKLDVLLLSYIYYCMVWCAQIKMMNSNKAVFNHILISSGSLLCCFQKTVSQPIHRLNSLSLSFSRLVVQQREIITIFSESLLQRLLSLIELTAAQKHWG